MEATSSSRIAVRDTTFYRWSSRAMISDVKGWIEDPASNFGWAMVGEDSLKQFASSEISRVSLRPELQIIYREIQFLTPVDSDLPGLDMNDIFYDVDTGLFWLAFATKGIGVVDLGASTWQFYTTTHGLPSNQVYSLAKVNGVMWVATQKGIARQVGSGSWRSYNSGAGLRADRVRRVYSDNPDRIWLSYIEAGAGVVDPRTAE